MLDQLVEKGVLGGVPASRLYPGEMEDVLIVASTETNSVEDLAAYEAALREVL